MRGFWIWRELLLTTILLQQIEMKNYLYQEVCCNTKNDNQ